METKDLPDLLDDQGQVFSFKDKKDIVIYFYPKDDTPGCTIENNDFSMLYQEFQKLNLEVVGVSRDSIQSHSKFRTKYNLSVKLLSDQDEKLYKILNPEKSRSTFLFLDQKLVKKWEKVNPIGHAKEVLDYVKSIRNSK